MAELALTQDELRDVRAVVEAVIDEGPAIRETPKGQFMFSCKRCCKWGHTTTPDHDADCAVTIARRLKQRLEGM